MADKQQIVWAIKPPDSDKAWWFGLTEFDAWGAFFKVHGWSGCLDTAKRAYKAIGYKAIPYRLVADDNEEGGR